MLRGGSTVARLLWLALVIGNPAWSDEPSRGSSSVAVFRRAAVLDRFDGNQDGKLNLAERRTLRAAFGGVDVPMLPEPSYNYSERPLPSHLRNTEFRQTDNTPRNNPLSDDGAMLGRVLFYDKQLSSNNSISCASCHDQQRAFADPRRFSVGFEGGRTGRNAMSLVNLRFSNLKGSRPGFFWDERAATLEDQVLMPIQDKIEMGMTLDRLEAKLQELPYYPGLFELAFGTPRVTRDRIAKAVAQFMRAMTSFESRFDRAAQAARGDLSADFGGFTAEQNLGKSLFVAGVGGVGEIGCAHCHMPPTFGMPKAFNNGLDLEYADQGLGALNRPLNDPFTPSNDGKFKAPSLRNVELTAPYMHDGRFKTLQQVMQHYSSGVHPHPNLGLAFNEEAAVGQNQVAGFGLTPAQQAALIAFLKTLTDERFIAAPRFSDPFIRLPD